MEARLSKRARGAAAAADIVAALPSVSVTCRLDEASRAVFESQVVTVFAALPNPVRPTPSGMVT